MANDFAQMTLDRLRQFLALDLPRDHRPSEGSRLDFKDRLPNDLGKDVAAMANTFGGTIIVGVSCEEYTDQKKVKHTIPMNITGDMFPGGEASLAITQRIIATIRPRPSFTIKVVPVNDQGMQVAIIQVTEGTYPPYEWEFKSETFIPVRVQDSTRRATLQDLERLFVKRASAQESVESLGERLSSLSFFALDHITEYRATNFIALTACPRIRLPLRFDREMEKEFRSAVSAYFFSVARGLEETVRNGNTFQLEAQAHRTPSNSWRHYSWNLLQGGGIGYTCNLVSPTPIWGPCYGDVVLS